MNEMGANNSSWNSIVSLTDNNLFRATCLSIGPISIDTQTGNVIIREGVTLEEASLEFWKIVGKMFPGKYA